MTIIWGEGFDHYIENVGKDEMAKRMYAKQPQLPAVLIVASKDRVNLAQYHLPQGAPLKFVIEWDGEERITLRVLAEL